MAMATKRNRSPDLVPNPFIKKRNLDWSIDITGLPHDAGSSSDEEEVVSHHEETKEESEKQQDENQEDKKQADEKQDPTPPDIEAGRATIDNHLTYFSTHLAKAIQSPYPPKTPNLSIEAYKKLYESNAGSSNGAHFVIHQHDHPIAGTHYDLRIQINETSSASWAIMYGLPGDPNSFRLNRNATETRVHCLWNHLIETASHETGSLLLWDTGTYSILPSKHKQQDTQSSSSSDESTEQEKLHQSFTARKIRLRLHGTRLPKNYVLNLRLTHEDDIAGRLRSSRTPKRRRRVTRSLSKSKNADMSDSDSDADIVQAPVEEVKDGENVSATERELRELEDEEVRKTNAYTGATNSIGSVHQRRWFLSLDREASGFVKRRREGRVVWETVDETRKEVEEKGERLTYPFYVRGVEVERSVVTGRLGCEVLRDEGVEGFIGRKGWQAIVK